MYLIVSIVAFLAFSLLLYTCILAGSRAEKQMRRLKISVSKHPKDKR